MYGVCLLCDIGAVEPLNTLGGFHRSGSDQV